MLVYRICVRCTSTSVAQREHAAPGSSETLSHRRRRSVEVPHNTAVCSIYGVQTEEQLGSEGEKEQGLGRLRCVCGPGERGAKGGWVGVCVWGGGGLDRAQHTAQLRRGTVIAGRAWVEAVHRIHLMHGHPFDRRQAALVGNTPSQATELPSRTGRDNRRITWSIVFADDDDILVTGLLKSARCILRG